jgi:hypothetical protein
MEAESENESSDERREDGAPVCRAWFWAGTFYYRTGDLRLDGAEEREVAGLIAEWVKEGANPAHPHDGFDKDAEDERLRGDLR